MLNLLVIALAGVLLIDFGWSWLLRRVDHQNARRLDRANRRARNEMENRNDH